MKELLKEILMGYHQRSYAKSLISRKNKPVAGLNKIQAIIGPRRIGKTSAMLLHMEALKHTVSAENLIYFNFEDERIQFKSEQLDMILQAWLELYTGTHLDNCYFFFDEVQAAPGWEKFINRINETYTKNIFFTGSNSAFLHTEINTVMRGRSIAVEMLPLSFREFCEFRKLKPEIYGHEKSKTIAAFNDYLQTGGYPEIVSLPEPSIRTAILQEYYNAMLLRDIMEYNQLTSYQYLRPLYRMAATTIGKTVSIRRLHHQLKALGYNVSINSVYNVMDMAENAYLFKRISKFDFSESKREKSDKKIYWLDTGMLNANTVYYTGNKGILLENAVFMYLYQLYGNIYQTNIHYYKDPSGECDFVVTKDENEPLPVQVCWSLSDPLTKQREIKSLIKACHYCRVNTGWIITADEEETLSTDGITIHIKAAWKWMLSS